MAKKLPAEGDTYKGWLLQWVGWHVSQHQDTLWGSWYAYQEHDTRVWERKYIASCCPGIVQFYKPGDMHDTSFWHQEQLIPTGRAKRLLGPEGFKELQEKAKRQTLERLLRFIDKNG